MTLKRFSKPLENKAIFTSIFCVFILKFHKQVRIKHRSETQKKKVWKHVGVSLSIRKIMLMTSLRRRSFRGHVMRCSGPFCARLRHATLAQFFSYLNFVLDIICCYLSIDRCYGLFFVFGPAVFDVAIIYYPADVQSQGFRLFWLVTRTMELVKGTFFWYFWFILSIFSTKVLRYHISFLTNLSNTFISLTSSDIGMKKCFFWNYFLIKVSIMYPKYIVLYTPPSNAVLTIAPLPPSSPTTKSIQESTISLKDTRPSTGLYALKNLVSRATFSWP